MHKNHKDPQELDLTKPRLASYKQKWRSTKIRCTGSIYSLLNGKGLKFYQTRSNAIILFDTLPAYCIYREISYKDNWMCDLDSDIAGSSKDTQRLEPKPKTQSSSTGRPVYGEKEEIEERTTFDRDTLKQEKHDEVTDPTSTERPVLVDQEKEHKIDFTVPRLSHATVQEAEHLRVQELVKKDRKSSSSRSTSCRLAPNNVYNPFIKNSKAMIRELVDVELFRVVRNYTKSLMFSLSPFLESRNCVLHLRTMLD